MSHKLATVKMKPLWDDHLRIAEQLVAMTDVLLSDAEGWTVQDDAIVFTDAALQTRYNAHSQDLSELIQRIDERSAALRGSR